MRVYLFALVPFCYLSVKLLKSRPAILYISLIILLLLHLPAHYGGESFEMVPTTEMVGASFYSDHARNDTRYFVSEITWRLILYHDPKFVKTPKFMIISYLDLPDNITLINEIGTCQYIVYSDLPRNMYMYYLNSDPLHVIDLEEMHSRIYDNGRLQIHGKKGV